MGQLVPGAEQAPIVLTDAQLKLAGTNHVGSGWVAFMAQLNLDSWLAQTHAAVASLPLVRGGVTVVCTFSLGTLLAAYRVAPDDYYSVLAMLEDTGLPSTTPLSADKASWGLPELALVLVVAVPVIGFCIW
jgi:hypothetical protein